MKIVKINKFSYNVNNFSFKIMGIKILSIILMIIIKHLQPTLIIRSFNNSKGVFNTVKKIKEILIQTI